jgi:hypothetical protein
MISDASMLAWNMAARTSELGMSIEGCFFDCDGFWVMMIVEPQPLCYSNRRWMKSYVDLGEAAADLEALGIDCPNFAERARSNPSSIHGAGFAGRIKKPKEALRTFHFQPNTMFT